MPGIRVGQLSQITFDASLRDILLPLSVGGTLVIPGEGLKQNLPRLLSWLSEKKIELVHTVPSIFRLLLAEVEASQSTNTPHFLPHHIFLAGEPLYSKDIIRLRAIPLVQPVNVINLYGTSETTMAKTFHVVDKIPESPNQVLPVGKPISNTAVAIISEGVSCQVGEIGEIYIKTPFWTNGYTNNEVENTRVFVQNPLVFDRKDIVYKTGDLGRYDRDGNIEVLGRVDDQVKINGIRVNLKDIERSMLLLQGINEAVAVTYKNENDQINLACYYTGEEFHNDALELHLLKYLSQSLIPSFIIHLDKFPLNINGKTDKKALPHPSILGSAYHPPANEMETGLEDIFKSILGLPRISVTESFFKIGGSSLKAFQVVSRVYKTYQVELYLREFFANSSIRKLAELIGTKEKHIGEQINPIPKSEYYEVSYGQKRLWIVDQSEGARSKYNMSESFRLTGPLRVDALKRAVYKLMDRHESLRTSFVVVDGILKQMIHPSFRADQFTFIDISSSHTNEETLRVKILEESIVPFDLQVGYLLRVRLLKTAAESWTLILTIHHIISDGWTMNLLLSELLVLYDAFLNDRQDPLLIPEIQYKDYAVWHNRWTRSHLAERYKNYWAGIFSESIPVLRLPVDFDSSSVTTYAGNRILIRINRSDVPQLTALCRKKEITEFNFILGSISIMLGLISGQKKFFVGIPLAGRPLKSMEGIVGFFVNLVPLLIRLDPDRTFMDCIGRVQLDSFEAFEGQLYPYNQLIEELSLDRADEKSDIFQVMIQKQERQHIAINSELLKDVKIDILDSEFPLSKYPLTFNVQDDDDGFMIGIEYSTELFKNETVFRLAQSLQEILIKADTSSQITMAELRETFHANDLLIKSQMAGMAVNISQDF
jgi:non-ribosomal peptide synthetase component F/acyl carrier protein